MTPTKTLEPAPPCSGEFRTTCVVCRRPTHPATTSGPNRACADGHAPYVGKGRCRPCYCRDSRAGRLPAVSPIPRPRRRARPPVAATPPPPIDLPPGWRPVPSRLRSTTPAPCDRCGTITRLPFGPGEALCPLCEVAQILDRRVALETAAS